MANPTSLDPQNTTALLAHRGRGNPLASHPSTAISNCFPGLEFDFRALWKRIFADVEIHEAENLVTAVIPGSAAATAGVAVGQLLVAVDGQTIAIIVRGPETANGPTADLTEANLEWNNSLAGIVRKAGQSVPCTFRRDDNTEFQVNLTVRAVFDGVHLLEDTVPVGALTQGLCSPWQNDYRECGCYYWAASRPDFVNVEPAAQGGAATGHNWMHKNRTAATPKQYVPDRADQPNQLTYEDLFQNWEMELRFLRKGKDSE